MIKRSAGGIIVGPNGLIALTNQNGDSWSFPKGHVEENESLEETARREIYEETGIADTVIIRKLGDYTRPTIGRGGVGDHPTQQKHITLFLATSNQVELQPLDPINPEARWVEPDEVADYLTHAKDIEFYQDKLQEIKEHLAS